jgi:hypothetical protein
MESKLKGNSVVTVSLPGNGIIRFGVLGAGEFDLDTGKCGTENRAHAEIHGFIQKVSDRAAIGRDPDTGKSASPAEKFAAMKECADRLQSGGPWNVVREGGSNEGGLLYRAMKRLYPNGANVVSRKAFGEWLESKAASESERLKEKVSVTDVRRGLEAVKSISAEIAKIRLEDGSGSKVDGKALLAEVK